MHGARRGLHPTGENAPNHCHGKATAQALCEDREKIRLLSDLEDLSFAWRLDVPGVHRWRGRKPRQVRS
jgi:hypothetical protein